MRRLIALALALGTMGFIACAQGTSDGPPGTHPDAHVSSDFADAPSSNFADAPSSSTPDAFVPPPADAFVPPTPDATNNLICSSTADCSSDSCCVSIAGNAMPPGLCTFKILNPPCDL